MGRESIGRALGAVDPGGLARAPESRCRSARPGSKRDVGIYSVRDRAQRIMKFRVSPEVVAGILAGALGGVAGALLFATLHALIIVPIWDRMTSGLIFGAIAGAAAGWALAECYPKAIRTSSRRNVGIGAGFGALLWLAVTPVTGADALLRAAGLA